MIRKVIDWIIILLMLAYALSPLVVPQQVFAYDSMVQVAPSVNAYIWSYQRRVVEVADLQWAFYSDGANEVYRTSADFGMTWSNATVVRDGGYSGSFTVATNGYYIDYDYFNTAYRRGIACGNGSITWLAEESATGLTSYYGQNMIDANGYPWFGYNSGTYYGAKAAKGNRTDGVWQTDFDTPVYNCGEAASFPLLYPETNGDVLALIMCYNAAPSLNHISVTEWSHAYGTWTSSVTWSSPIVFDANGRPLVSAAINIDNTLGIAAIVGSDLVFFTYNSLSGFSTGVVVQSSVDTSCAPSVSYIPDNDLFFCYWVNKPVANGIYMSYSDNLGVSWSSPFNLGNDTLYPTTWDVYIGSCEQSTYPTTGLYYLTAASTLKFCSMIVASGESGLSPVGQILPASDITARTATLNGHTVFDGLIGCNATFYYKIQSSSAAPIEADWGVTVTGQYITAHVTDLVPHVQYVYWIKWSNDNGDDFRGPEYFTTSPSSETGLPIVSTWDASNVGNDTATLNGYLDWDGNSPGCVVGFRWRVHGDSWNSYWKDSSGGYVVSPATFSATMSGLIPNTTYDFQAQAANVLGNATAYQTKQFTTSMLAAPTPTSGINLPTNLIPPNIQDWLNRVLGDNIKILIAIVVTIGSMFLVSTRMRKSSSSGTVVMGTGIACVVIFTFLGWYPRYVIILIGGIVALLLMLSLQRGGSH